MLSAGIMLTAGCGTTAPWPDRPWVDAGCDAPGPCRVRGVLEIPEESGEAQLRLADGRRLAVILPDTVVERADRWNGRRVALGGEAVAVEPDGVLHLRVRRLSLKGRA